MTATWPTSPGRSDGSRGAGGSRGERGCARHPILVHPVPDPPLRAQEPRTPHGRPRTTHGTYPGSPIGPNGRGYASRDGPGLDAGSRETPGAMSDIPPFREPLAALGVSAALFDPRSPADIAEKIG